MTTSTTARPGTGSVLDLHRAGALVSRYPQVARLLADLAGPDLLRAGRLLARLDPAEVLREHPGVATVRVAVTGHGTVSTLVPALTAELARHGLLMSPYVSDFDSYVVDLGDPRSALYASRPDLTLCVVDAALVFEHVPNPWGVADLERVVTEKVALLARLAATFQASCPGTLVLNTMPLPRRFAGQLVDHRSRARLGVVWREANARLLRLAEEYPAVVVLDLDVATAGGVTATDPRLSVYAKVHRSNGLAAEYAREVGHLARHLTGRTRKVLALDLDGTVWGGVLGDDGAEGIEVADGYRGAAFRSFQQVIRQFAAQGVLVAAVSKNDPQPVRAVLRDLPGMTLREDDFVGVVANWRPKTENLAELARTLNVGVDSFVFVDDSPYECGLVRHALPEVAVVQVDGDPALHVDALLREGWFDVREVTVEDRSRVGRYRDELVRRTFLDSFDSIDDYLRELSVEVRLAAVGEPDVARVSQLTLRTNQFNLTGVRLQPDDVRRLAADPAARVLAVHARDRFGDNGLVGAVLLARDGDTVRIDNFLLSCRVFARGIEPACLAAVLRRAREAGVRRVTGAYRPTPRNGKVADFYPRYGFVPDPDAGDAHPVLIFRHDLAEIVAPPAHVRLTEDAEGIAW